MIAPVLCLKDCSPPTKGLESSGQRIITGSEKVITFPTSSNKEAPLGYAKNFATKNFAM